MPVFSRSKLIHVHIPKTAGTFIERSLREREEVEFWSSSQRSPQYANNRWYEFQHLTLSELSKFAKNKLVGYQSFAVLRNPYERLVSEFQWRWNLLESGLNIDGVFFKSFDDLIDAIPLDINLNWDYHISQANRRFSNFLIHIRPQKDYVCNVDGSIGVDQLVRHETINPDLNKFLLPLDIEIPNIRNPREAKHPAYFHKRIVNLVNEIYEADFTLGGYTML